MCVEKRFKACPYSSPERDPLFNVILSFCPVHLTNGQIRIKRSILILHSLSHMFTLSLPTQKLIIFICKIGTQLTRNILSFFKCSIHISDNIVNIHSFSQGNPVVKTFIGTVNMNTWVLVASAAQNIPQTNMLGFLLVLGSPKSLPVFEFCCWLNKFSCFHMYGAGYMTCSANCWLCGVLDFFRSVSSLVGSPGSSCSVCCPAPGSEAER